MSTSPGLADALDSAYHLVQGKTVFFGMADTIMTPVDVFDRVLKSSDRHDEVMLGLFRTERPEKFGMVQMERDDYVQRIVDKPSQTDLEYMWGFTIWRPRFTEHLHDCIEQRGLADFAIVMNAAIETGMRFRGVRIEDGTYIDVGTYEEIAELEKRFRST